MACSTLRYLTFSLASAGGAQPPANCEQPYALCSTVTSSAPSAAPSSAEAPEGAPRAVHSPVISQTIGVLGSEQLAPQKVVSKKKRC